METLTPAQLTTAIGEFNCRQLAEFLNLTTNIWCTTIDPERKGHIEFEMHQIIVDLATYTPEERLSILQEIEYHTLVNKKPSGDPV